MSDDATLENLKVQTEQLIGQVSALQVICGFLLTTAIKSDASFHKYLKDELERLKTRAFEKSQEPPQEERLRHKGFFEAVQGVIRNFDQVPLTHDLERVQPNP